MQVKGPAAKRRGEAEGLPSPALGRRRADPRGAAGTWKGAERKIHTYSNPVAIIKDMGLKSIEEF